MKPSRILLYTFIVVLIIFALMFLTGCTNDETYTVAAGWNYRLRMVDHYANGMHYKIFFMSDSGGLGVINVTLDSLQIENLKRLK